MDTLKGTPDSKSGGLLRGEEMNFKKLGLVLAAFLLIGLFLVIMASHYIGLLHGEAIVVSGTLQGVSWDEIGRRDYGLELYVNGDVYNIVRYSALSRAGRLNYGIEGDGYGGGRRDSDAATSAKDRAGNQARICAAGREWKTGRAPDD